MNLKTLCGEDTSLLISFDEASRGGNYRQGCEREPGVLAGSGRDKTRLTVLQWFVRKGRVYLLVISPTINSRTNLLGREALQIMYIILTKDYIQRNMVLERGIQNPFNLRIVLGGVFPRLCFPITDYSSWVDVTPF